MTLPRVELDPVLPHEVDAFCSSLQESFNDIFRKKFGDSGEDVISVEEIMESIKGEGAETLHIVHQGQRIGGAVVRIDKTTQENTLDLIFISPTNHGRGIGSAAWQAIEARYPATKKWSLVTPCFEKRNIHFYVNKCGFHIVEYYNEFNPDPNRPAQEPSKCGAPDELSDEMFRFEKIMV